MSCKVAGLTINILVSSEVENQWYAYEIPNQIGLF